MKTGAISFNQLIWKRKNVNYMKKKYLLNQTFKIPIEESIAANISDIYLLLLVKQNNPNGAKPVELKTAKKIINWFVPKPDTRHNLLHGENRNVTKLTPIPYIYRTCRFDFLVENRPYNWNAIMPFIQPYINFNKFKHQFFPALIPDTFFDIPTERRIINMTQNNFSLNIQINLRDRYIWQTKKMIEFTEEQNEFVKYQINEIKRIFIETNPLLLWSTGIASFLHFIFQVLAFEKDLEFWKRKSSLRGVSLRTILLQAFAQVILFLNLLETDRIPFYIKLIDFAQIIIQLWKIKRLIKMSKKFPFIKTRKEYRGETNEADSKGMKFLYILLLPLIISYSIYQLIYGKHRGIRSYFIHCASGAIYSFGFLAMLPQLYVNYKLKTVAGMSRSALIYKFISTFIDDLYTFVSKMPLMNKIACFRDDVIFIFWLVQCVIYPVDPTRVNEYGYVKEEIKKENDHEEKIKSKEEKPPEQKRKND